MFNLTGIDDVIYAPISPSGRGAVSQIRVSGPAESIYKIRDLITFLPKSLESHKVYYGFLKDNIDEVLVSYFARGKSFSGEETFEIACHGNPLIVEEIINKLSDLGFRLAQPGEFSYRAIFNGRIDIAQAEAIHSAVSSSSLIVKNNALKSIKGHLSDQFKKVEKQLIHMLAHLEADIDFSEEDLFVLQKNEFIKNLTSLKAYCISLKENYIKSLKLNQGLNVVLYGPTNAGKSSLFNELIGEDRAIVSDIAGTTRDYIEKSLYIDGIKFNFIDTAGVRETNDEIESIGISKGKDIVVNADIKVMLLDSELYESTVQDPDFKEYIKGALTPDVVLLTKSDLFKTKIQTSNSISISLITKEGLESFKSFLSDKAQSYNLSDNDDVILSARQDDQLTKIINNVDDTIKTLTNVDLETDLAVPSLQLALENVHQIYGIENEESVRDYLFKEFCLGK